MSTVVITTITSQQKQVQGNKAPKSFYSGGTWLKKAEGKEEGGGEGRSQGTKWKLFLLGCGQLSSCPNLGDVLDAPSVTVFAFSFLRLPASRVRDNASVALPSELPIVWNFHRTVFGPDVGRHTSFWADFA